MGFHTIERSLLIMASGSYAALLQGGLDKSNGAFMSLVLSHFDKAKRKRKSEDLIFFRVDLFCIYDFTIRISPLEINKLESPKMT